MLSQNFGALNHRFLEFGKQDGNKILLAIDFLLITLNQQTWDWCSVGIYFHPEMCHTCPQILELNHPRNTRKQYISQVAFECRLGQKRMRLPKQRTFKILLEMGEIFVLNTHWMHKTSIRLVVHPSPGWNPDSNQPRCFTIKSCTEKRANGMQQKQHFGTDSWDGCFPAMIFCFKKSNDFD